MKIYKVTKRLHCLVDECGEEMEFVELENGMVALITNDGIDYAKVIDKITKGGAVIDGQDGVRIILNIFSDKNKNG